MSIDVMPFIGSTSPQNRVHAAVSHNMEGFALGPATGVLVADLMAGDREQNRWDSSRSPTRFSRRR